MLEFLIFCLSSSGMTWIIVNGFIFDKIRPDYKFFKCSACVGFHSGWFMFLAFWFSGIYLFPNLFGLFVFGCVSSLISYVFDKIMDDDGIKINLIKQ